MVITDITRLQEIIGVHFHDQDLLLRSLTHPSYCNEHPGQETEDNERLEFLGDAVLDFVSGEWLYQRFPKGTEGYLTRLRAALVRTERLARFCVQYHIDEALLLGHGEEDSGGRTRVGNLCAVFEAVVGAIYLDQGLQVVRDWVFPLFGTALEEILQRDLHQDARSLLQEWSQAHMGLTPSYRTVGSEGPDHAKLFTVAVYIGERCYAEGSGSSKQTAAQMAAQRALEQLRPSP